MKLKKYIKIVENQNYASYYKQLKKDSKLIKELLSKNILVANDYTYFTFIVHLWKEIKSTKNTDISFYLSEFIKNDYKYPFESYEEYYKKNAEKFYISETDKQKVLDERLNIYIHQRALERIILEDLKSEQGLTNIKGEFFINKLGLGSIYTMDLYGNYCVTGRFVSTNFFFSVIIITDDIIFFKPLKSNYENLFDYDNPAIIKSAYFNIPTIKNAVFKPKSLCFIAEPAGFRIAPLSNAALKRLSIFLQEFFTEKEIPFKVLDTNVKFIPKFHTDNKND